MVLSARTLTAVLGTGMRPQRNLVILVGVILTLAIFIPLLVMIAMTFQPGAILPFPIQNVSLESYRDVFLTSVTYRLMWNTALYAGGSIVVGMALATFIAWFVGRTDLPLRNTVHALVYASFGIPGLIIGLGWAIAAAPRSGYLNQLIRALVGSDARSGPIDIFSWYGLILVTGLSIAPSMFVFLSSLFERMDPSLEEASQIVGANRLHTLRHVTLPLMRPGLATVVVYFTTVLIQSFEIPLALGIPARIPVLSTQIYIESQPEFGSVNYSFASTVGIIALVTGLALMAVYFAVTRYARQFQVITGKDYKAKRVSLRGWKWPVFGVIVFLIMLKVVVPIVALAETAFLPLSVRPWEHLGDASFDAFRAVFDNHKVRQSLLNTLLVVLTASTVGVFFATLVAWLSLRSRVRGAYLLQHLSFLPLPIPAVVMALGLLLVAIRTPLWGSIWIIAIAHIINFQPFGVRLVSTAVMQIGDELEEAGQITGGSPFHNFRHIVVPLIFPAIRNAWMWMFAHSARDFTYPLMFRATNNLVIATVIWEFWQEPAGQGEAAALSLLLVGVLWLVAFLPRYGHMREQI